MAEFNSPYASTLGLTLDRSSGRAIMTMAPCDGVSGRPGFLHGGAIAGLLENTAWVTVLDALPAGTTIKPISLTVDYLRGGALSETYAEAQIVRLGRRIANVLVTAWLDDRAKAIASANIKLMIER